MQRSSLPRLGSVDALLDPGRIGSVLQAPGPVRVEPLSTQGYSGSRFFQVHARDAGDGFIVKETVLAEDWFSRRTGDRVGREAAALLAPELAPIHEIFALPYRAVAVEPGRVAVLMDDVSRWLLPDERAPLEPDQEESIVEALAELHATFWESPGLEELDWLHGPDDFLHVMGPGGHGGGEDEDATGGSARGVDRAVREGWKLAREILPDAIWRALRRPAREIAARWDDLPVTLVHGDSKVANFALLPGRRPCVFDWAFVGRAPCTFEMGWYVAVNAPRLVGGKEETLRRYRRGLEGALGHVLDDALWDRMEEAGVVCGALMLLWSKARALEQGRAGARAEWDWWEARLEGWA